MYYRCQHDTRGLTTREIEEILARNPSKRFKNTNCPFQMSAKVSKMGGTHPCKIIIEWCHNHPIKSLQAKSFKDLSPDVTSKIKQYFADGMTPGTAYQEFIRDLRSLFQNDLLGFHATVADRSK